MPKSATLLLFFVATFLQAGAYGLTFLLPDLFQQFGANEKVVGQMLGITTIATLGSIGFSGHLTDRIGRLPALALSCALIATALILFASAREVGSVLVTASFLLGSGWGLAYVLPPVVLTRLAAPDRRVRYFAMLAMSMMAGFGLSPVIAAVLVARGADLGQVFNVYAVALVLAGILFAGLRAAIAHHAIAQIEPQSRISFRAVLDVMKSRAWLPIVMGFLGGSVFAGMNNFQTVIAADRGLEYASYFLTYTVTVVIFRILLLGFNGGKNPYRTIGALQVFMTISAMLLLFSGSNATLYVLVAVLFGVGYGASYPILAAMAANDARDDLTAQTLLVFAFAYFIGVFGFPLIAGWIIVEMGIAVLLGLTAGLAMIEASLAFWRGSQGQR